MSQVMTIARPYAEAVFQYATEQGQIEQWSTFLEALAEIAKNKDIQRISHSPKVSHSQIEGLLEELTGVETESAQGGYIRLLLDNKRLLCSPEIAVRFKKLVDQSEDTVDVEMQTVVDVTPAEKESFTQKFSKMLGCHINLQCKTNKEILGGFIVHYNDKVIDSSLKGQINQLAQSLTE